MSFQNSSSETEKHPSAMTRDDLDSQSAEKKITKENGILQGKNGEAGKPLDDAKTSDLEFDAMKEIQLLRSEKLSDRIASANRLEMIAKALSPIRVREEFLPYITESVDDEDEVLCVLSTSIGKLVPYVGGGSYAHTLLIPLEELLSVEESTVRENAMSSVFIVADALPDEVFQENYAKMVSRLASKEWFTARMSSCALIAKSYERFVQKNQQECINHFARLCRDETPMVRRVASQNLGCLLENIVKIGGLTVLSQDGVVANTIIPLYEELAVNDQDSVRLQTTENCISFGKAVNSVLKKDIDDTQNLGDMKSHVMRIVPLAVATIDDRSWRVRWTAASKFADVVKAFLNIPGALESLVPAYEKLLQDPEAEVRTAATFNLAEVAKCNKLIAVQLIDDDENAQNVNAASGFRYVSVAIRLVERVNGLTEDDSENVRAALAMVATGLAPTLGKDETISHLVPPVLLLLRDATPEVRLNLISSLSSLNEVVGVDLLSQSLLPAILDLAQDMKWRIRLAIIKIIPPLAKQLGEEFFSDHVSTLCVSWLADNIANIREAAVVNIKELTALFGSDWAQIYFLPSIIEMSRDKSYLLRLTAAQTITSMATVIDSTVVEVKLLPLMLELAGDAVPNVRFNVAKGLQTMSSICGNDVSDAQIRPILTILQKDTDRDVSFFASKALEAIDKNVTDEVI